MTNLLEEKIASVTQVSISLWGNTLKIEGIDDPFDRNKYAVVYKNCKKIEWEIIEHDREELASPCVNLAGWQIGEGNYESPAIITTGFFEIWISYESYEIQSLTG